MGFLRKRNQAMKQIDKDEQEKNKLFLDEYRLLSQKHGRDFHFQLSVTPQGIVPIAAIGRIEKGEPGGKGAKQ